MKYLPIVIFALSSLCVSAQAKELSALNELRETQSSPKPLLGPGSTITAYKPNTASDIKGSVYLFDTWYLGSKIYFENQEDPVRIDGCNFNIKDESFEMMYSGDSIFSINSGYVDKVLIANKTFKKYIDPDLKTNLFFEEVYSSDKMVLLKKYELDVKEGMVNQMTGNKLNPDKYVTKETYFVVEDKENPILEETKLNKKLVNSLITEEDQAKVKKYAKDKHLSYKEETDVRYILNYAKSI